MHAVDLVFMQMARAAHLSHLWNLAAEGILVLVHFILV
jgi:hypothetical protein